MQWLRRNAVGLLGVALGVVALAIGAEAYRTSVRRDEQARAIPRRLERGEADLAERHRRSVEVLTEYADALRAVTYYAAGFAAMAAVWHVSRGRPNLWLTGLTAVLILGAVSLALASRPEPGAAADAGDRQAEQR